MSFTTVLLPILAALGAAEQFMGLSANWLDTNPTQKKLITYLPGKEEQLSKLSEHELKTIASFDYQVINKFLKDHGFNIQLDPFKGHDSFGVAAILDILVEWSQEGAFTTLVYNNQKFPAVSMAERGFEVVKSDLYEEPILKLTAKNGDIVYMTIAEKSLESFELLEHIQTLSTMPKEDITEQYREALFPMVDLNHETDISWLLKLGSVRLLDRVSFFITQALQQTKFAMNEKGARAQSAVALAIEKTCIEERRKTLLINKPFYLWIERPGMNLPLFTAYIDTSDWKKPNALSA